MPLMGHSLASAMLGLVGQPRLQKWVQKKLGGSGSFSGTATNLVASAVVSPIYVVVTNPLSRLEVIMQTNSLTGKSISPVDAVKELAADMSKFGLAGIFRGQGIGIAGGRAGTSRLGARRAPRCASRRVSRVWTTELLRLDARRGHALEAFVVSTPGPRHRTTEMLKRTI